MGRLVYTSIGSLDGFIADANGEFDWSAPDAQVHGFLNERDQDTRIEYYGRRLYDVLKVWQTYGTDDDAEPEEREYGELWRARDKVVFSRTLADVDTDRTVLRREFDPSSVRAEVDAIEGNAGIGGPALAAHALRAGIVDVVEYYLGPVIIGSGTPWLPADLRLDLKLVEQHQFDCGVVFLSYEVVR